MLEHPKGERMLFDAFTGITLSDIQRDQLFCYSFWHLIWRYLDVAVYFLTFYSDILFGPYSAILSGTYSDIFFGIFSGILSDILSGICSDFLSASILAF